MKIIIRNIRKLVFNIFKLVIPEISYLKTSEIWILSKEENNVTKGLSVKLYGPYHLSNVSIGNYTYVAQNSFISFTSIGSFCSIGPNLICGWGVHPTNGISTAPMFYSSKKQNGTTLSKFDKIKERKHIQIGNDVFIGANVTILDGIEIGDGAIIGAGAVVSKNIEPFSIAVGNPIKVIKKRFDNEIIEKLLIIKWWDFNDSALKSIEEHFFNVNKFISEVYLNNENNG